MKIIWWRLIVGLILIALVGGALGYYTEIPHIGSFFGLIAGVLIYPWTVDDRR